METPGEGARLQTKKRGPEQILPSQPQKKPPRPCLHHPSATVRQYIPVTEPLGLWYFVVAVPGNSFLPTTSTVCYRVKSLDFHLLAV